MVWSSSKVAPLPVLTVNVEAPAASAMLRVVHRDGQHRRVVVVADGDGPGGDGRALVHDVDDDRLGIVVGSCRQPQ